MQNLRRLYLCAPALAGALLIPFTIQAAPLTCAATASVPPILRAEGKTEPLADLVVVCTGGVPTPPGALVPQVNFRIFLNTNVTSLGTAHNAAVQFDEALLLVDEPNSLAKIPQRPLLNCGQTGAADNGPSGPGVCEITSTGVPSQTYDGTPCVGAVLYGCGRPNAFQGRLGTTGFPALNVISFLGVPFDPPGGGSRILRFTNLRGNAEIIGSGTVEALINIQSGMFIPVSSPIQTLGFILPGLTASVSGPNVVRVTEGFASSWKDRNVAFTVGNPYTGEAGNATAPPPPYSYPATMPMNYPHEVAQNVPGTIYNTEDLFQWQTLMSNNGPPTPNPPPGFGIGPVLNLGQPLDSLGLGGLNTGINGAGVASQGTRIALSFTSVPAGNTVVCASSALLYHVGAPPPGGPPTGIMVLTSTDANGANPYSPPSPGTLSNINLAVYEVLYADPFALEYADIPCFLKGNGPSANVTVSFAPFYGPGSSDRPTPTAADPAPPAIPRFATGTITLTGAIGPG